MASHLFSKNKVLSDDKIFRMNFVVGFSDNAFSIKIFFFDK